MTKGRVLLVDDESYVSAVVGLRLQQAGFEVIVATDGEEAYQIACSQPLNMIVTDCQMPNLSGLELGKLLKSNPKTAGIPAMMLTARGHRITPSELAQTTIRSLHAKPFSARELVRKVEEMATPNDVESASIPAIEGKKAEAA